MRPFNVEADSCANICFKFGNEPLSLTRGGKEVYNSHKLFEKYRDYEKKIFAFGALNVVPNHVFSNLFPVSYTRLLCPKM